MALSPSISWAPFPFARNGTLIATVAARVYPPVRFLATNPVLLPLASEGHCKANVRPLSLELSGVAEEAQIGVTALALVWFGAVRLPV